MMYRDCGQDTCISKDLYCTLVPESAIGYDSGSGAIGVDRLHDVPQTIYSTLCGYEDRLGVDRLRDVLQTIYSTLERV